MKKKFPTDKKIHFLIADDIRQEISGKAIIIGYYSGESVAFSVPEKMMVNEFNPLAYPALCFLWVFTDGEGEFDAKVSITHPDGVIAFSQNLKLQKNPDGAANLLIRTSPFIINTFGEFECIVDLGEGHKYIRKFSIIRQ